MKKENLKRIVSMMLEEFPHNKSKGIEGFIEEWIKEFLPASMILGIPMNEQDIEEISQTFVSELRKGRQKDDSL